MITRYKEWNTALWNHFFPEGDEDPVLAIDENLLKEIGERAGIRCEGINWKEIGIDPISIKNAEDLEVALEKIREVAGSSTGGVFGKLRQES